MIFQHSLRVVTKQSKTILYVSKMHETFLSRLETASSCNVKTFLFSLWNGQVLYLPIYFSLFLSLFSNSDKDMNMTPGNPPSLSYLYQLVFGLYMLVTTVVLINLLIAMMSDTYQRIQVNRDFSNVSILQKSPITATI